MEINVLYNIGEHLKVKHDMHRNQQVASFIEEHLHWVFGMI